MPSRFTRPRLLVAAAALPLLLLVLLLALSGWLAATESGARAAFGALASLSQGAVQVDGVRGRLIGPLRLQQLTLEQPEQRLTLGDVRLDWHPLALFEGKLHIASLHAGYLGLAGKLDQKPKQEPRLPDSIALPFSLQADQVRIDSGQIGWGPLQVAGFGPLAFGFDFDGAQYRLRLYHLSLGAARGRDSAEGSISGQATLSATSPYPLQASFASRASTRLQQQQVGMAGHIAFNGSLAELRAELDLAANEARVQGHALLRPFSLQMLGPTRLAAQALDLAKFDPDMPRTQLQVDLSVAENGAGELSARNGAPGAWGEGGIPLSALSLAFRQQAGQYQFDRILAKLGTPKTPAGDISGSGSLANGALTLALHTDALDLRRIDARLRSTRLAGDLTLRHAAGRQEFTLDLQEPVGRQRIDFSARGSLANNALEIKHVLLRAGSARAEASAQLSLTGRQSFSLSGKVSRFRLREFGRFPDLPELDLNGEFSLKGARAPQLEADLEFHITDSRLAGHPLLGDGQAQLRADRLLVPGLVLQSGQNRLQVQGSLTQQDSRLTFALNAPRLAQLGPGFGGAIEAGGVVRGTFMRPHVSAEWTASNVRAPGQLQIDALQGKGELDIDRTLAFPLTGAVADASASGVRLGADRLASFNGRAHFAPRADAPLLLALRGEGLAAGQLRAERFTVSADGTTARHAIHATLNEPAQGWDLKANGGWNTNGGENRRWQGMITGFDAAGRFEAHLVAPAALLLAPDRVRLDRFVLETDAGRVAIEQFARDADGIATHGRIERLQVAQLLRRLEPAPPVATDLQLAAQWELRIADTVSGSMQLRRESGDVTMLGDTPVTLGLQALDANASADGGRITLQVQAEGQRMGRIEVQLDAATATSAAGRLALGPDTPVTGSARIDMPSLAWLAPLASPGLALQGRLQGDVAIAGTAGRPRLDGRITGDALRVALPELGIDLRQGVLQSEFQDDRLLIRELSFQGGEGRVSLSGPIALGAGASGAQLALAARRFTLLNRADRRFVLSGDSVIQWKEQQAKISGAFTVDSGFIDLGGADKPELSDDVVIVGRARKPPARTAADIDLAIALGDGVGLKWRGLDAVVAGKLRVASEPGEPLQTFGTLHAVQGTYTAYGRELTLEQGTIRFNGKLNNPGLDVLAMRRGQEVEAGVSVGGTILAPRVALVSEPVVPDAEKLSWLVLGRGLSTTGETDVGVLQDAAAALLSESAAAGVQSRIAGAFGLDTLSVGKSQDNLQQHIVTLGKQLSSRLYLSYQQGLETASSVVQLRYILTPSLSLEAEAGARSALSLFYNIAFD